MAKRALVIGSSVAGLAAARALSDKFDEVLVIERDERPPGTQPRKGAPQGRHVHALLRAGEDALESLFPGLMATLESRGAHVVDLGRDLRWYHHDVWKVRYESGVRVHCQSRPLLEECIRERVAKLPNVSLQYGTSVVGMDLAQGRVAAVTLRDASDTWHEPVSLVVDASGRGSLLGQFLETGGFAAPVEERVGIDLQYASVQLELDGGPRDCTGVLVYPTAPAGKRAGIIFPIEGGRHVCTLVGWQGDHPPQGAEGFAAFARSLGQPDIARELARARQVSEIALHKFPYARRRRFDKLQRLPAGLLALGDAVCSFDPVFGQGMSAASLSAVLLGKYLERDPGAERPLRYFKALMSLLTPPWLLATSEDFRYPECTGERPPGLGLLHRYTREVFKLTGESPAVYAQFLRVMNLLTGPEALFHPSVLGRVLPRLLGLGGKTWAAQEGAPQTKAV
jgi:2-polyprenyl-6-methoxyphenol hydroxylase-like FAD-dependent oxidoreductase